MVRADHLALIKELWVSSNLNGPEFSRASYGERGIQKPKADMGMLWCINNMHAGVDAGNDSQVDVPAATRTIEPVRVESHTDRARDAESAMISPVVSPVLA